MGRKNSLDAEFVKNAKEYNSLIKEYEECSDSLKERKDLLEMSTGPGRERVQRLVQEVELQKKDLERKGIELERKLGIGESVNLKVSYTEGAKELRIKQPSPKEQILIDLYFNGFKYRYGDDIKPPLMHSLNLDVPKKNACCTERTLHTEGGDYDIIHGLKFKKDTLYVKPYLQWAYHKVPSANAAVKVLSQLSEDCKSYVKIVFEDEAGFNPVSKKQGQEDGEEGNEAQASEYVALVNEYNTTDKNLVTASSRLQDAEKLDDRENIDNYRGQVQKLEGHKSELEGKLDLEGIAEIIVEYDDVSVQLSGRPRDMILANYHMTGKLEPEAYTKGIISALVSRDRDRTIEYISSLQKQYSDEIRFIPKRVGGTSLE